MNVGGVVLLGGGVFHLDVFKIAYGIEAHIAVESAIAAVFTLNFEAAHETVDGFGYAKGGRQRCLGAAAVGQRLNGHAVGDAHRGQRVEGNKRAVVFAAMIIGALHESTLRKEVAHFQIGAHRRAEVAFEGTGIDFIRKRRHEKRLGRVGHGEQSVEIVGVGQIRVDVFVASARERQHNHIGGLELQAV